MRLTPFLALFVFVMLAGNRTPPKWQASGKVALDQTAGCAKVELGRFGEITEETGQKPEAGSRRLKLWPAFAKDGPMATIYMDGEPDFTAMWMDAEDRLLGDSIWRQIRSRCGVA